MAASVNRMWVDQSIREYNRKGRKTDLETGLETELTHLCLAILDHFNIDKGVQSERQRLHRILVDHISRSQDEDMKILTNAREIEAVLTQQPVAPATPRQAVEALLSEESGPTARFAVGARVQHTEAVTDNPKEAVGTVKSVAWGADGSGQDVETWVYTVEFDNGMIGEIVEEELAALSDRETSFVHPTTKLPMTPPPEGFSFVPSGPVQVGDLIYSLATEKWSRVRAREVGTEANSWHGVARKTNQ
jgi:hypothetical protein